MDNKSYKKYLKYKTKYNYLREKNLINLFDNCKSNCVRSHSQNDDDYIWLTVLGHGKVQQVYFEEPVGSDNWRLYDDHWWNIHCKVIDHHPNNLVRAHMKAFIEPGRFARMLFIFEDGTKTEPTELFWKLEENYFREKNLCE